jgi:predicted amidohydrolase
MPRKIVVATASFGLPANSTAQRNLELAYALLDAAGSSNPDVVCLPETFSRCALPGSCSAELAEPIPGPVFDALCAKARRHRTYVVAGLTERRDDQLVNTAVLIGRDGSLVGQYDKIHPTIGEVESGIVPADMVKVFDLDVGRVGIAICFDIGWPAVWDELGRLGAEIVFWPSAYDGGFPLQTYAWRNSYYVVSSVWSFHSRIIDITGQHLASTSRFSRLVSADIDLEKRLFHTDQNANRLLELTARFGRRITVESFTEEHIFTLQSNDPSTTVEQIARDFGLEPFREYHRRSEAVQDEARAAARAARKTSVLA